MYKVETDWLKKWAKYTPDRMAFREHQRNIEWSYFEFNNRTNLIANYLTEKFNLKKGDRVAVYSKNRAEYVSLFFACAKSGLILVPLNLD
jgi:fatty-acyl-CoA synthase